MGHAPSQIHFAALDPGMERAARAAAAYIGERPGQPVRMEFDARMASLVKEIMTVFAEAGGIAYGALGAELSPEQAGKVLGVSRPLVVQRMEDGRLPFHLVGTHRRCKLTDVLALKARENSVNEAMAGIYEDLMDLDDAPAP